MTSKQRVAEQSLMEIAANELGQALLLVNERAGRYKDKEECTSDELAMRQVYSLIHTAMKLMADIYGHESETVIGQVLRWHWMIETPKGQYCYTCGPRGGKYPCKTVQILREEETI